MSGDHTPAVIATASIPASVCEITTHVCRAAQSHWRQARLIEARGILADIAHHPDTLALLACQVICAHSPDPVDGADALGMMRLLRTCSLEPASTARKGGAA